MTDFSRVTPPVPVGPVIQPAQLPRRPFYRVHDVFTMPDTGKTWQRGDSLSGADALAFEVALAAGEVPSNVAVPAMNHLDE